MDEISTSQNWTNGRRAEFKGRISIIHPKLKNLCFDYFNCSHAGLCSLTLSISILCQIQHLAAAVLALLDFSFFLIHDTASGIDDTPSVSLMGMSSLIVHVLPKTYRGGVCSPIMKPPSVSGTLK